MFKNLNTSFLAVNGGQSEVIEQALTYRFRGMDLDVADLARRVKLHGLPHARRLIDSSRLKLGAFWLPFELDADNDAFNQDLAQLADWAGMASELGCRRCLITVQPASDRLPYHENFTCHCERLAEICKTLKKHDICLGVGFRASADLRKNKAFQFIHEFDALVLLTKMANSQNIGIHLDAWDLFASGGTLETLAGLDIGQIVAVRLADAPGEVAMEALTEKERILPSAEGRFPIPAVLATLAEMGYTGPVTIAPHRGSLTETRIDRAIKAVAESFDQVWKAARLTPQGKPGAPAVSIEVS